MESRPDPAAHWDGASALGNASRSWFQREPELSLQMLDTAGVAAGDSLIDVGGGASPLVDVLLSRGYKDVTVLDVSVTGMQYARWRLGPGARQVRWLVADVLTWHPERRYQAWHDRAVFHFLTTGQARQQYMRSLHAATAATAVAVFGCFAPEGPQRCSGLPAARFDSRGLGRELVSQWALIAEAREEHVTPVGLVQPFTWAAFRRQA